MSETTTPRVTDNRDPVGLGPLRWRSSLRIGKWVCKEGRRRSGGKGFKKGAAFHRRRRVSPPNLNGSAVHSNRRKQLQADKQQAREANLTALEREALRQREYPALLASLRGPPLKTLTKGVKGIVKDTKLG